MELFYGESILDVDHISGDRLDNRLDNLRYVTKADNAQNLRTRRDNSSGYRGVIWNSQKQKWIASVQINKRRFYLGQFDCKEEANEVVTAFRLNNLQYSDGR